MFHTQINIYRMVNGRPMAVWCNLITNTQSQCLCCFKLEELVYSIYLASCFYFFCLPLVRKVIGIASICFCLLLDVSPPPHFFLLSAFRFLSNTFFPSLNLFFSFYSCSSPPFSFSSPFSSLPIISLHRTERNVYRINMYHYHFIRLFNCR